MPPTPLFLSGQATETLILPPETPEVAPKPTVIGSTLQGGYRFISQDILSHIKGAPGVVHLHSVIISKHRTLLPQPAPARTVLAECLLSLQPGATLSRRDKSDTIQRQIPRRGDAAQAQRARLHASEVNAQNQDRREVASIS